MIENPKSPKFLTSQELEDAIRRHREYAKLLIAEAKTRRAAGLSGINDTSKAGQTSAEPEEATSSKMR